MMLLIQWMAGMGVLLIAMLVGWAAGYHEGRADQRVRIEKLRRALELANRQG